MDSFKEAPITADIDKLNNHFVVVLTKITEDHRESKDQNQNKNKLTKSILDLMQKRKELYIKNNHNKIEYVELNKLVTKKHEDNWNHNMLTIHQGKGYKSAKEKLRTDETYMTAIKEEEGSITRNKHRIVESAKKFYEKLYSSDINNNSVIEDKEFNELTPHSQFLRYHQTK